MIDCIVNAGHLIIIFIVGINSLIFFFFNFDWHAYNHHETLFPILRSQVMDFPYFNIVHLIKIVGCRLTHWFIHLMEVYFQHVALSPSPKG